MRRHKPVCPPKPADLAQRFKVPGGRVSLPNLSPATSTSSISSNASLNSSSSGSSLRHLLHRRNPVIPDTVRLPHGVTPQAESHASSRSSLPGNPASVMSIKRREQPGRRKDSTQSLYIDGTECDLLLHFSSCPPSASSSSTSIALSVAAAAATTATAQEQNHDARPLQCQRRFSDPDIPYVDNDDV